MKDKKNVIICIITSMVAAAIGFIIGINVKIDDNTNLNKKEKEIVGTYKTTAWNGDKEKVLVLNKDKTCIHPTESSNCNWKLYDENNIIITIPTQEYVASYLEMFLNEELSEEDAEKLIDLIKNVRDENGQQYFQGVIKLEYIKEEKLIKIYLSDIKYIEPTSQKLEELPNKQGVGITFSINSIKKYVGGYYDTTEDITIRIVDGGILLNGIFFEKIKKSD